jgi:integrase
VDRGARASGRDRGERTEVEATVSVRREGQGYRADLTVELPNGRKVRDRKYSENWTRREAEQWERARRGELLNPTRAAKADAPTVETFFAEWLRTDCVARGNRASTIREKRRDGRLFILPKFGSVRLDEITFRALTAFVAFLTSKDQSPKSQRNVCATLRRMLVYAAKLDLIPAVPEFPSIKVPRTNRIDYFTREEIETLLGPVSEPRLRAELLVAFDCGLRSGEQIALTWGAVNLAKSSAYPHGALVISEAASRGVVGKTKSGEVRHVPLTARCASALKSLRGLRHLDPTALVFPDPRREKPRPLSCGQLAYRLERACARASLRRLHRHGARHSFASNHVALGTPLLQVSKWLGHSDVSITARVYAHLAPSDGARWVAAYEAATAAPVMANVAAE